METFLAILEIYFRGLKQEAHWWWNRRGFLVFVIAATVGSFYGLLLLAVYVLRALR